MATQLSAEMHTALLNFLYELPNEYREFPEHVLSLIDRYLGFHTLSFIPLNMAIRSLKDVTPDTWLKEYRALGFPQDVLDVYNTKYHQLDTFQLDILPQKYWYEPVAIADDIYPNGSFRTTDWGAFLHKINCGHQAVVNLNYNNIRLGLIGIWKPNNQPFTAEDKLLLREMSRFITQHYLLAIGNSQKNIATKLFKSCYKDSDVGVILVDNNLDVLNVNLTASRYAQELLLHAPKSAKPRKGAGRKQWSTVQQVLALFSDQLFYSNEPFIYRCGGYQFEFYVSPFVSSSSNLSKVEMLYMVTLLSRKSESTSFSHSIENGIELTDREKEIAELLISGRTNEQIADELVISINTAKSHIQNIYKKMGVNNRAALVRMMMDFH